MAKLPSERTKIKHHMSRRTAVSGDGLGNIRWSRVCRINVGNEIGRPEAWQAEREWNPNVGKLCPMEVWCRRLGNTPIVVNLKGRDGFGQKRRCKEAYPAILNRELLSHLPTFPTSSSPIHSRLQGRHRCHPGRRLLHPCFRHGLHH